MDPDAVREFARRDRATVAAAKADWWARRPPGESLRAGRILWEHARLVRPDWPSEQDRAEDLAQHVKTKALLDQAGRALARR